MPHGLKITIDEEHLPLVGRSFLTVVSRDEYLTELFEKFSYYGTLFMETIPNPTEVIKNKICKLVDRIIELVGFKFLGAVRQHCGQHYNHMPNAFKSMQGGMYVWSNVVARLLVLSAMPQVYDIVRKDKATLYEIVDEVEGFYLYLT